MLACAGLLAHPARAAVWSWSGGGGANAYWNNSANWGFLGTPGNGDTVVFPAGSLNALNTNNITGLTLNQIRFVGAGGGYEIRGNDFTLTNSIVATNTTGANTIENNITLGTSDVQMVVSNGASLTLAGVLSGSVGVNKTGLGTLTYQAPGNNLYTGTTLVSAGTLQFNVASVTAVMGPLVIGDGTGAGSPTVKDLQGLEMTGIGPVTINLNGLLDLNNMNEPLGFNTNLTLSGGTIQTGTGTLTLSPNTTITVTNTTSDIFGNLNTGSGTLTIQGNGFIYMAAAVSGSANIVQNDAATISWWGANTCSGTYTINGYGSAYLNTSLALGNPTNALTLNGQSSVFLSGNSHITNQSLTINSANSFSTIYTFAYGGPTNSWQAASFTLGTTNPIFVDTNCSLNLIGRIGGPGGLTKTGAGTLTLTGATNNTYSGLTTVSAGELNLNNSYGFAIPSSGPGLVIGSGATVRCLKNYQIWSVGTPTTINGTGLLDLNGHIDAADPLTLNGGTITTGPAGQFWLYGTVTVPASSTISGNVYLNSDVVINDAAFASLSVPATISGSYGLTMAGPGSVLLLSSNSYGGLTIVQQGFLWAENNYALGSTSSGTIVSNGASLVLPGNVAISNEPLTLNGPGVNSSWGALDAEYTVGPTSVWAGPITLNADGTIMPYESGAVLRLQGPINGPAGFTEGNSDGSVGTLSLEGTMANTYGGLTTVSSGTLLLNKTNGVRAVPGNLAVSGSSSVTRLGNSAQLAGSLGLANPTDVLVTNGGSFDFATNYDYVNTLRGNGTVNFGNNGYLIIGGNNGSSEFDGPMTGAGNFGTTVSKFGNGTFTLGGNNTFTNGETEVSAGKLVVNGAQPLIPVGVDTGGTLGGTGVVGEVTAYGIISPGEGPGILSSSNVDFTSSGNLTVLLAGPNPGSGYSQLNVTGIVSLANPTLTVLPAFNTPPGIGQQFTIIKNNMGYTLGTFSGLANGVQFFAGGYLFGINYNGGAGYDVVLTVLDVPISQNTITLNAVASGWYDSAGYHDPGNSNYIAGAIVNDATHSMSLYRNFFVFNAPVFSGSITVNSAELILNDYTVSSSQAQASYVLSGVTTPIYALEGGGSGLPDIYSDLGDGPVYGVRAISTNETSQRAIIPLNPAFLSGLAAASGGQIALGGAITDPPPTNGQSQFAFGYSTGLPSDAQLRVSFGPTILINSVSRGWYSSTGYHDASNPNYFVGVDPPDAPTNYHNFFVFNLPVWSNQLASAELFVNSYSDASPSGFNTYQLHGVTTPIATLTNNASGATDIYNDLADGALYGGRDVYVSEAGRRLGIPLNGTFIGAAQAHSGGPIALGGAVTSLTPASTDEYLFGLSGGSGPGDVQLSLGFFTAPAGSAWFAGGTPAYLGNSRYQFTLNGATGTANEIQASFDFQNWDYICDVMMSGATATFLYTNNVTVPYRFFRARLLP